MPRLRQIRTRIILLILLALVPMLGVAIYDVYSSRDQAYKNSVREIEIAAESILKTQTRVIEAANGMLETLVHVPEIVALDRVACGGLLAELVSAHPRYASMSTIRHDGSVICSSAPFPSSVNLADRAYFRRALETETFAIGDYQIGRATGKASLGLAMPLMGPDRRPSGVLVATLSLDWLAAQVDTALLPPESVFLVFDPSGNLLVRRPLLNEWIGKSFAHTELFKTLSAMPNQSSAEAIGLDGKRRVYYVEKVRPSASTLEAVFAFGFSADAIEGSFHRDLYIKLSTIGVFSLGLLFMANVTSRRMISGPLERLIELSSQISGGDFSGRSGLARRQGEFGRLAESLDSMAARLQINQGDLEQRNRLLNESQEAAQIGSWQWHLGDPLISITPELARIFGRNPNSEQMPVEDLLSMVHPDDRQSCLDTSARVAQGQERAEMEFRLVFPDGEIRHCWAVLRQVEATRPDGVPVVRGTTQDITDRKRAEKERDRNAQMIEAILDSVSDGIIACDAEGHLSVFNAAIARMHGVSFAPVPAEQWAAFFNFLGHDSNSLLPKEALPLYRALQGEVIRNEELRFISPGGKPWVSLVSGQAMIDRQGRKLGAVISVRDVSELRNAEFALAQAQKMEAIGQLTGGVAHDFNNLLAIIIGNLDLLTPRLQRATDRELVEEALAGALRGAELSRQMLTFARRQPLAPVKIDLRQRLDEFSVLLKRTLGETIVIKISTSADLWHCLADANQLESALLNLAINARDAMPGGGALTIEANNTQLDAHYAEHSSEVTPGDYVKISVSDTGTGISPEILARVLEPFFTTKEPGKGTGLGLSMVYGFAKQSNGHLKIYSEPGHGTTVNLYLPRQISAAASTSRIENDKLAAVRGHETILVVDDNAAVRRTAMRQLTDLGYNLVDAGDAKEALDVLRSGKSINLLFSDVVMPGGMTGFDLAQEVQRQYPGIKILLVTGFAEAATRRRNELGDSVQLMTKPYRRDELATRIRDILDRH